MYWVLATRTEIAEIILWRTDRRLGDGSVAVITLKENNYMFSEVEPNLNYLCRNFDKMYGHIKGNCRREDDNETQIV